MSDLPAPVGPVRLNVEALAFTSYNFEFGGSGIEEGQHGTEAVLTAAFPQNHPRAQELTERLGQVTVGMAGEGRPLSLTLKAADQDAVLPAVARERGPALPPPQQKPPEGRMPTQTFGIVPIATHSIAVPGAPKGAASKVPVFVGPSSSPGLPGHVVFTCNIRIRIWELSCKHLGRAFDLCAALDLGLQPLTPPVHAAARTQYHVESKSKPPLKGLTFPYADASITVRQLKRLIYDAIEPYVERCASIEAAAAAAKEAAAAAAGPAAAAAAAAAAAGPARPSEPGPAKPSRADKLREIAFAFYSDTQRLG